MLINKAKIFFLIILVFFLGPALGFEVTDEADLVNLNSGAAVIKYINVYNFDPGDVEIKIKLNLEEYPGEKPAYQINLAALAAETLILKSNKKMLLPVYIDANKNLPKGKYIYWLNFEKTEAVKNVEDVLYTHKEVNKLPLIIVIQ